MAAAATAMAGIGASWSSKWSGMSRLEKPWSSRRRARSRHSAPERALATWAPKRKGRTVMSGQRRWPAPCVPFAQTAPYGSAGTALSGGELNRYACDDGSGEVSWA